MTAARDHNLQALRLPLYWYNMSCITSVFARLPHIRRVGYACNTYTYHTMHAKFRLATSAVAAAIAGAYHKVGCPFKCSLKALSTYSIL